MRRKNQQEQRKKIRNIKAKRHKKKEEKSNNNNNEEEDYSESIRFSICLNERVHEHRFVGACVVLRLTRAHRLGAIAFSLCFTFYLNTVHTDMCACIE